MFLECFNIFKYVLKVFQVCSKKLPGRFNESFLLRGTHRYGQLLPGQLLPGQMSI